MRWLKNTAAKIEGPRTRCLTLAGIRFLYILVKRHKLSGDNFMRSYLKLLLSTESLAFGTLLCSNDPRYSCVVQDDGSLELTGWPVRLRSLHQATRATQELVLYGAEIRAKNIRTANPLLYWSYFDTVTNQQEKLHRLWQLSQSSLKKPDGYCALCVESANAGSDAIAREDAITLMECNPTRAIVAPRHHFTEIDRIPLRDARKLTAAVFAEVQRYLGIPGVVRIETICSQGGHVAYEVRHMLNANDA